MSPALAAAIEAARVKAGLTKFRLAVVSGLSLQTVRGACQGIATTRTIAAIAKAVGVSIDELTGRRAP